MKYILLIIIYWKIFYTWFRCSICFFFYCSHFLNLHFQYKGKKEKKQCFINRIQYSQELHENTNKHWGLKKKKNNGRKTIFFVRKKISLNQVFFCMNWSGLIFLANKITLLQHYMEVAKMFSCRHPCNMSTALFVTLQIHCRVTLH